MHSGTAADRYYDRWRLHGFTSLKNFTIDLDRYDRRDSPSSIPAIAAIVPYDRCDRWALFSAIAAIIWKPGFSWFEDTNLRWSWKSQLIKTRSNRFLTPSRIINETYLVVYVLLGCACSEFQCFWATWFTPAAREVSFLSRPFAPLPDGQLA